jgi:hypothetical protein
MSRLVMALAVVLLLGLAATAADSQSPRQYYGPIHKHASAGYSYRAYYYKPTPTYAGYKHHYALYFPTRPKHIYFFNPYSKLFWGRCPVNTAGKPQYSLLAEKDRKGKLDDIPEAAFPEPGPVPPIPESDDNASLELPPDDLPGEEALPSK